MYLNLVQLCFLHCIFCSATNYFESIYYPFIILTKLCVKRSCSGVLELHWKMYFRVVSQHSQNNVFSTVVSQLLITHSVHFTSSMLVLPVGPLVEVQWAYTKCYIEWKKEGVINCSYIQSSGCKKFYRETTFIVFVSYILIFAQSYLSVTVWQLWQIKSKILRFTTIA